MLCACGGTTAPVEQELGTNDVSKPHVYTNPTGDEFPILAWFSLLGDQVTAARYEEMAEAGFNMECIKSRPRPHVPFEYYFYIELVGGDTPDRDRLMERMNQICQQVRLLGVYNK